MNIKSIFAFGIVFLIPTHVLAEFTCKTNISYSWRRGESEENVHWVHLWEKSQDQDAAKQKLVELGIAERAKAMSACRRDHENLAGCIGAKFSSMSETYKSLSFPARKALEDAISKDCANAQGECLQSVASEIECVESKAEAPAEGEAAEGEEKKEEKKK